MCGNMRSVSHNVQLVTESEASQGQTNTRFQRDIQHHRLWAPFAL